MLKFTIGMSSDDSQQLNFDDIDMTMDDFPDFGKESSYICISDHENCSF